MDAATASREIVHSPPTPSLTINPIEDLVSKIGETLHAALAAESDAKENYIAAGRWLGQLKKLAGHGRWLPCLAELKIDERSAQRYMRMAALAESGSRVGNVRDVRTRLPKQKQLPPPTGALAPEVTHELPDPELCLRLIDAGYKQLVDKVKLPALDLAREYFLAFVPEATR